MTFAIRQLRSRMRAIFLLALPAIFSAGDVLAQISLKPELHAAPSFQLNPARTGAALDSTGWRFATKPIAKVIDDKSGEIRFKITVDPAGAIESVLVVSSTVSARQEALCRQALLLAHFERVGAKPGGATGYYTFKINIR